LHAGVIADSAEAAKIIESYRQAPPLDDETAEING